MHTRIARLVPIVALGAALALPGATVAADPSPAAPPAPVVDWQTHLSHMQAMSGTFDSHVRDCIAAHGSMARQLGPSGSMVEMMGEMVR